MRLITQRIRIRLWSIIVLFSLLPCCGCDTKPNRVTRVQSNPYIPAHPLAESFLGKWEFEGEIGIVIARDPDGRLKISSPDNDVWESVVNHVRFIDDELHFDQYFYFIGPDDFTMPESPTGDHPFSGVQNHTVLALVDDAPDKLESWLVSDHPELKDRYFYTRKK